MPRRTTQLNSGSVTLKQVAERAGFSATTVSLALRNHPKISESTRSLVVKIADELGYRRNPLVSAHMAYVRTLRSQPETGLCIAFLGDRPLSEIEADNKTQVHTYYRSAKARAMHLGYEVSYFNFFDPGMTGKRLSQILVARGIRGVIIAPFGEAMGLSEVVLDWNSFAMVMIDHALLEPPMHQVANDEFTTIGKMIQRLLDCGFRRLGIAMRSSMDEHANHFWLAGYQTFQDLTEPQYRIPHFITPKWSKTDFLSWYYNWKPEAIITINDDIVRWLREVGVRVPEDVSCATLYWKEDRSYLSGYYQNHELIASAAVDMMVGQLNRNECGLPESEKSMLVKAVWKDGETILPKKAAMGELPLRVWKR